MEENTKNKSLVWRIVVGVLVILLVAAVITLSVLFSISQTSREASAREAENGYQRAFYSLLDNLDKTEFSLKKLDAASSPTMQGKFLGDAGIYSGRAAEDLNSLAVANGSMNFVVRSLNQVTGYCEFMNKKISAGEELSGQEKDDIKIMKEVITDVTAAMTELKEYVTAEGYNFSKSLADETSDWCTVIAKLEAEAEQYPIFNFEGNICNELGDKDPKSDLGEAISVERGAEIVAQHFAERGITDTALSSENERKLAAYYYSAKINGTDAMIEVSKKGGHILNYTLYREVTDPRFTPEEAQEIATQYVGGYDKFGEMEYYCMSVVNSTAYVDFVSVQDGVLMLSDKVQVKVALDDGEILGLNSYCFFMNNHVREGLTASQSEESIKAKVSRDIEVSGVYLVMYAVGSIETLAYEVRGAFDGNEYYIYFDADKGYEIDIKTVIDSDEGRLFK